MSSKSLIPTRKTRNSPSSWRQCRSYTRNKQMHLIDRLLNSPKRKRTIRSNSNCKQRLSRRQMNRPKDKPRSRWTQPQRSMQISKSSWSNKAKPCLICKISKRYNRPSLTKALKKCKRQIIACNRHWANSLLKTHRQ